MSALSLSLRVLCLASLFSVATAGDLKIGDAAPAFTAVDEAGTTWDSAEHFGKEIVVVYFYPADMTGGCTAQACAYRDAKDELADLGVTVVGVSGDTAENHAVFKQAHSLNFTLLADPDGAIAEKFGVPYRAGSKSLTREVFGVEHVLTRGGTAKRWTFVVAGDGQIAYIDNAVNAKKDTAKVLRAIADLKK